MEQEHARQRLEEPQHELERRVLTLVARKPDEGPLVTLVHFDAEVGEFRRRTRL